MPRGGLSLRLVGDNYRLARQRSSGLAQHSGGPTTPPLVGLAPIASALTSQLRLVRYRAEDAGMPNHNTHFIVENAVDTSGHVCRCRSWIQHWRNFSGGTRRTCAQLGCQNEARVGAHVVHADRRRRPTMHIAPLCHSCNHWANGARMIIDQRTWLVPAHHPDCAF